MMNTSFKPSRPRLQRQSSWKSTFSMLDANKSGFIDASDLKASLKSLGQPSSDEHISKLLEAEGLVYDENNCSIDCDTFLRINGSSENEEEKPLNKATLLDVFRTIDLDASEYITAAKLHHFLSNIGMFLSDDEISQLLRMYDTNGSGRITFDSFIEIVADLGFPIDRDSLIDTSNVEVLVETEPKEEEKVETLIVEDEKIISLSSIVDENLRLALAPFDKKGNGSIDLREVKEAAKGKIHPKLHWSENRPRGGLSDYIHSVDHIAILVSDVAKSAQFYRNIIGLEQVRRPNFDSHGAWFTMGNIELHLIKGNPVVHQGDDLVVGHISLNAVNIGCVLEKLRLMNVPFRKNTSVPAGKDAGSMNTNKNNDMMSNKIVTQFFIRDPDGYYLEVCNCDEILEEYCLGGKEDLAGYEEGIQPLSLATASTTLNLMQRWVEKLHAEKNEWSELFKKAKETDGSIKEISALINCTRAEKVDETLLATMMDRRSIYGDVCQNEEEVDMEEIILASGNDARVAEVIIKLREKFRGYTIFRPPAVFNADGTKYMPSVIIRQNKD